MVEAKESEVHPLKQATSCELNAIESRRKETLTLSRMVDEGFLVETAVLRDLKRMGMEKKTFWANGTE